MQHTNFVVKKYLESRQGGEGAPPRPLEAWQNFLDWCIFVITCDGLWSSKYLIETDHLVYFLLECTDHNT